MRSLSLSQRLSIAFAALLIASCGASLWLQVQASRRHEQLVIQRLSSDLAAHIADNTPLMTAAGWKPQAIHDLFSQLMAVNPSVEVYLLSLDGRIVGQAAPPGHLKRDAVDLRPIKRFLANEPMPILGDDPRSLYASKVFSAAPVMVDGHPGGYVYVVLLGEEHDELSADVSTDSVLRTTLWSMGLTSLACLLAGLIAFRLITRPLRELTGRVRTLDHDGLAAMDNVEQLLSPGARRDEIATLAQAFGQMGHRIAMQWREINQQDQQRRELVANISHDLRTPLTSLHGYLETLLLKADALSAADRRRYLEVALGQSRKVGRLAQELFELARLEHGDVMPEREPFSLADLVQDVVQKFELAAEARSLRVAADIGPGLPAVNADLGMIERVLTNLLDNAIRHTPAGGEITIRLRPADKAVAVEVSDTGPGISPELSRTLFTRPAFPTGVRADGTSGGLGLMIVHRILQLHGSAIRLVTQPGKGAVFAFEL